jgi:hypothetical protein
MHIRLIAFGLLAVVLAGACVRALGTRGGDSAGADGPRPLPDTTARDVERGVYDAPRTERPAGERGAVDSRRDLPPIDRPLVVDSRCGALANCGGECVSILSDPNNCGDCGKACTTASPCMQPTCMTGKCAAAPLDEGTPCPSGTCHLGSCCTGCWDGASCQPGTTNTACGKGGAFCSDCTVISTTCNTGGTCS